MSVGDWNKIGQNQRVRIMTVDPVSRKVEAATKDGAMIQIAVWGQPTIFRWPIVGETWIVTRMGGFWILVEPVQKDIEETAPLEDLNPGDVIITTGENGRVRANNRDVVITDQSLATNGDAPIWDGSQWIPGAAGGSSSASAAMLGQSISSTAFAHVPPSFWLRLDGLTTIPESLLTAGWTVVDHLGSGHPTMLVPPDPGVYVVGANVEVTINGFAGFVTDTTYFQGGPAIIGGTPGSYFTEYGAPTEIRPGSTGFSSSHIYCFNGSVMAPNVGDGSNTEVGFGWVFDYVNMAGGGPAGLDEIGWHSRLWAYRVG